MKIGIYDLNNCSLLNYKERIEIYKQCGFTSVGLYLDDNYMFNNENYLDIIEYARKVGLEINQVHIDYKSANLICDDSNNIYFDYVEKKIKECKSLKISYIVLHTSKGNDAPLLTNTGLKKLENLMDKYNDSGVCLCFENVRDNRNLEIILSSSINNIRMCYDMGHAYCYDDEYQLIDKYRDKIMCSHLHNNYKVDSHNMLFDGEIDSRKVISLLNENILIDNCLEVFPKRGVTLSKEDFISFVKSNFDDYIKCIEK